MWVKLESRRRIRSAGTNRHSRDFFKTLFEVIFTDDAQRLNLSEDLQIPEILVYFPSKSASTKDMLKLKFINIHIKREETNTEQQSPTLRNRRKSIDSQRGFVQNSPPCHISVVYCSISIADSYSVIANNEIEVPTYESTFSLFRAENLSFRLETNIRESRVSALVHRVKDKAEASYKRNYRSKEFHISSRLPPIEMEFNPRSVTILLQLFNLWVTNVPLILHPYLQTDQLERVKTLVNDSIFQKFKFSEEIMDRIMNHMFSYYDVVTPFLRIRYQGEDNQTLCLLAEHFGISSIFSFFHHRHTFKMKNISIFEENSKTVYFKLVNTNEASAEDYLHHSKMAVTISFNDPYLLSTFKKLGKDLRADNLVYPLDFSIHFTPRTFISLDPTSLLKVQKIFVARSLDSKKQNEAELAAQVSQGNRLRNFRWEDPRVYREATAPGHVQKEILKNLNSIALESHIESNILKLNIQWENGIVLQFLYLGKEIYTLYAPKFYVLFYLSNVGCVHVKAKLYQPMVLDSTEYGRYHPTILESYTDKHSSVSFIFTTFSPEVKKEKRHKNYLGVICRKMKVNFLKRRVQEIVEYFRKHVLHLFLQERVYHFRNKDHYEAMPKSSETRMEIYLQQTIIAVPRGSLSHQGVVFYVDKVGIWSIGQWGRTFGSLFRSGHFSNEYLAEEKFYDVLGEVDCNEIDNIWELLFESKEQQLHGFSSRRSNSSSRRKGSINQAVKDGFKIFATQLSGVFTHDLTQKFTYTKLWFEERAALQSGKFVFVDINFEVISNFDLEKKIIPLESR